MELGGGSRIWVVVMMLLLLLTVGAVGEKLHKVGNSQGWNPNFNYTNWSLSQQFYVADWLYFAFDKRYYNVLEVNRTNYESCNDKDFITNITRGGRDVFQLTEARPYFFLSSGGYCFQGMKLAVSVSERTAPAPAPAPAKSGASPTASYIYRSLLLFVAFFYWVINLSFE
ncbi:lamin-like protein [Momordica charantia]|uniref:Lamin-like protein n=1 Tax=Momordica charantia TaxID=3673 RepID=A0A6J1CSK5_MOMCH|nr:lamin-like protein [Momordica charantia]